MGMFSPRRPVLVASALVLAVIVLVGVPVRAQACELLNQLLVGCSTEPAPPPSSQPPPSLPPLGDLPGVITLPGSPEPPKTLPPTPAPASPTKGEPVLDRAAANRLLELANGARAAVGAQALTSRPDVVEIAAGHSLAMAERGSIFHNVEFVTDVVADLLQATWVRGENVAWSNNSIEHAHRLLMQSQAHRTNLLDPRYSVAGFAVARSSDGNYWVTQNFLEPRPVRTRPRPAATPVVPKPATPFVERVVGPTPQRMVAPLVPMAEPSAPPAPHVVEPRRPMVLPRTVPTVPERLSGAVLVAGQSPPEPAPSGVTALAGALAVIVALGHGVSWWVARRL